MARAVCCSTHQPSLVPARCAEYLLVPLLLKRDKLIPIQPRPQALFFTRRTQPSSCGETPQKSSPPMTHQAPTLLAAQLRSATRTLHGEVERAGIMPVLLRGELPVDVYVAFLRNLHAIYAALEPALTGLTHDPRIAPVWRTDLFRLPALESDLNTLSPQRSWRELPVQAATQAYVARLLSAANDDPVRLVAHAYVRYLGDLSGGQMLSRTVSRLTERLSGSGVAFYDFGDKVAAANHARDFRGALDSLPLTEAETAAVVDEAIWAFKQHGLIFEALMAPAFSAPQVLSA